MNTVKFELENSTNKILKKSDILQKKSVRLTLAFTLSILMPLSLWIIAQLTHNHNLKELRQTLDSQLKLYSSNIISELEKYEYLPIILANDPFLTSLFNQPLTSEIVDQANRHLSAIQETTQISAVYVMDKNGNTLASSNWDKEDSFVGRNFEFRPYFQNALKGEIARYFALGTTSLIPGYYISHPIHTLEGIKGVIVVKVSVARLENAWADAKQEVFVSDDNNVVIITGSQNWKFRTLKNISPDKKKHLIDTMQYGQSTLNPIQTGREIIVDDHTRRVSILSPIEDGKNAKKWSDIYIRSLPIIGTNWTIHYIIRENHLRDNVIDTLTLSAFAWLICILVFLFALQRRNLINNKLEYQAEHQRTLENAAYELEARVKRRTQALQDANNRLEEEIKERLKAEDNLHRAQDELIQASKLAALGQMAAGITHEMNQPLTAIRNYSDNAQTFLERKNYDNVRSNLTLISELCSRLGKISGQLKVFARKTPSVREPIHLFPIIQETLTLLKSSTSMDDVIVENRITDPDLVVLGEAIRLEQVLLNILRNAIDALNDQKIKKIILSYRLHLSRVLIDIHDNGPGFKDDDLQRIFDPFFTTKEVGKGLGLGLSISSRIIQDFGGVLKASNHIEGGALFTIELIKAQDG